MSYEKLLILSRRLLTLAPNGESMVSVKPRGSAPVVSIPASPVTSTPVQPKVSLSRKEATNVLKKKFSFGEIDHPSVSEVPIPDSPVGMTGEGPSKPQGKGADPRNWGNISFGDFTEADFNAQREALDNFAEINRVIKQEEVPTPPRFFRDLVSKSPVPEPKPASVQFVSETLASETHPAKGEGIASGQTKDERAEKTAQRREANGTT
jgi:hypothetical protein